MLEPLELSFLPSCSNCISWSADGEIAIAAGELVYVLTPRIQAQPQPQQQDTGSGLGLGIGLGPAAPGNSQWTITKIKTNIFTEEESPSLFPEAGSTFSLGLEQSLSHVVAVSWSPPGLAAYSRCILGVLTSNLVLSFWQSVDGSSRWGRVLIVNHSLRDYFMLNVGVDADVVLRKQRIRAFSWSHPLNLNSTDIQNGDGDGNEDSVVQRAKNLFVVSNDVGDVVFLKVRDGGAVVSRHQNAAGGYAYSRVEVLSHHALDESRILPSIEPTSLFASSLRDRAVITEISWSPWVGKSAKDDSGHVVQRYQALVAVVKGSELDILRVEMGHEMEDGDKDVFKYHGSILENQELRNQLKSIAFKGPLYWIPKYDVGSIGLAVGIVGGSIIFAIRQQFLEDEHHDFQESDITIHKETFDSTSASWYPTQGFASTSNNNDHGHTSHLYISAFSSYTKCIKLPIKREEHFLSIDDITPPHPPWQKQVDSFRNRFDLDYDLGGTAMAKTWGLASSLGWTAVCCSFHPTDMAQHVTASKERLTIVFTPSSEEEQDQDHTAVGMPWHVPRLNHEDMQRGRAQVLRFTLNQRHRVSDAKNDPLSKILLYAASCCAIIDQPSFESGLLDEARQSLLSISDKTGLDLGGEISTIDSILTQNVDSTTETQAQSEMEIETGATNPEAETNADIIPTQTSSKPTISPKTEEELQRPGARDVFEVCDICTAGIEWYSSIESQCKEGHMFVRCGLTFLSIQDPSISKRCSRCDGEFIDEGKLVAQYQASRDTDMDVDMDMDTPNTELLSRIAERFTSCIYCGGRFRV